MWNKELYLDIAAIPIYIIIWYTTIYRKMTKGRSNVLFLWLTAIAFFTDVSDLISGICANSFPLSNTQMALIKVMEYVYFIMRNGTNIAYLFFVFSVTRTWCHINTFWKKLLLMMPFLGALVLLASNEMTSAVFTVTPDAGYVRGEYIMFMYMLAFSYLLAGMICLLLCRPILDLGVWLSLSAMYLLNLLAVGIQFMNPGMLLECYFTSITLLFVVLFVQRPEKQVDVGTGLLSYRAFCEEIGKIKITGQDVQIIFISIKNADEMNQYLGDKAYSAYIYSIEEAIAGYSKKEKLTYELYFEQPGNFCIIMEDMEYSPVQTIPDIRDRVRSVSKNVVETGARPDVKIVTVKFPKEINDIEELLRFGHNFVRFANVDRIYSRASAILKQKAYQVETHIDEILNRAMGKGKLRISYQPIWSVKEKRFISAEAVVQLDDEVYGEIDTDILISAAEDRGLIIRLGNYLMDQVFSFVGEDNLSLYGYLYIDINLSLVQCMQMNLPDQIWELREKYGVHPEQICFAIKESMYENMSGVLDENLKKLSVQGYRLALDGYGKGYSNMQRILELPIQSVRLDKSLILGASSEGGRALLKGNIRMLQNIPLEVVAQGADDESTAKMLLDMGCGMIQGQYFVDRQKNEL